MVARPLHALMFFVLLAGAAVVVLRGSGESADGFLTSLPPDAPTLAEPTDGSGGHEDPTLLRWFSQSHVSSYRVQVSVAADFSGPLLHHIELSDTVVAVDNLHGNTTFWWRVSASNVAGEGGFSEPWSFSTASNTAVTPDVDMLPGGFALLAPYPNPFNSSTTITWQLPEEADVTLVIHNSIGQAVRVLVRDRRPAGEYRITWDGKDDGGSPVASGIYTCRLSAGGRLFTQDLVLVR